MVFVRLHLVEIQRAHGMVGEEAELFFRCFHFGAAYVIDTRGFRKGAVYRALLHKEADRHSCLDAEHIVFSAA